MAEIILATYGGWLKVGNSWKNMCSILCIFGLNSVLFMIIKISAPFLHVWPPEKKRKHSDKQTEKL